MGGRSQVRLGALRRFCAPGLIIPGLERERERRENAQKNSLEELNLVIEEWARQKSIKSFFNEIEAAMSSMDPPRREALSERLELARKMVGETDALQSLIDWETPSEKLQHPQ